MTERKKFHDAAKDGEAGFAGEVYENLEESPSSGIYVNHVERQNNEERFNRILDELEDFLSKGKTVAELIENKIVDPQSFVTLFYEYKEGRRNDPGKYQDTIKKYFNSGRKK